MRGSDTSAACPHWNTSRAGITEDIIVGRSQCTRRRAQMLVICQAPARAAHYDPSGLFKRSVVSSKFGQRSLEVALRQRHLRCESATLERVELRRRLSKSSG
jgi:hypothetical protein